MSGQTEQTAVWAVVPASGIGSRMLSRVPKQYLHLNGKPCLQHSLDKLSQVSTNRISGVEGICVCLSKTDEHYAKCIQPSQKVFTTEGGAERCHSVLHGLRALLARGARAQDWVLVHDAARPCVRPADIANLLDHCVENQQSGILATRVADTVKLQDHSARIAKTIDREGLWLAQTPQCARLDVLIHSLEKALAAGKVVTDEASALELNSEAVQLVQGSVDNMKLTKPEDVWLIEKILERQGER